MTAGGDGPVWKVEKESKAGEQAWRLGSQEVEGSEFKAFLITGELNVSTPAAAQALRNKIENSKQYLAKKDGQVQVLSNTPEEMLVYSVYHRAFPFQDRATCKRFTFSENEGGILEISWTEDWSQSPPLGKGIIEIPIARGSWTFQPLAGDRCQATYQVHTEPAGSMPVWLANARVAKGLLEELYSIEKIAKSQAQDSMPTSVD